MEIAHRTAVAELLAMVRALIPPSDAAKAAALREMATQDAAKIGELIDAAAAIQREFAGVLGEFVALHGVQLADPWSGEGYVGALTRYGAGSSFSGAAVKPGRPQ